MRTRCNGPRRGRASVLWLTCHRAVLAVRGSSKRLRTGSGSHSASSGHAGTRNVASGQTPDADHRQLPATETSARQLPQTVLSASHIEIAPLDSRRRPLWAGLLTRCLGRTARGVVCAIKAINVLEQDTKRCNQQQYAVLTTLATVWQASEINIRKHSRHNAVRTPAAGHHGPLLCT